jgi:hypothetical protein
MHAAGMTGWFSARIIKLPMLYKDARTARTFNLRRLWQNFIFTGTSVTADGHINDDGDRNWALLTGEGASPRFTEVSAAMRRWTSAFLSKSAAAEQTAQAAMFFPAHIPFEFLYTELELELERINPI